MKRTSLKIVGASGQGINSVGEILAKGLKRSGYCVFGYREYPSLIKGGHASYQLDVSDEKIESTETQVDMLITFNHHGLELNLRELKPGAVVVHSVPKWDFGKEDLAHFKKNKIRIVQLPVDEILAKLQAKAILANVVIASFAWAALGRPMEELKTLVGEKFAKKKALLDLNMKCIEEGFAFHKTTSVEVALPKARDEWKHQLLITGSQAMGLGAVHAGVRFYAGYPMTPSSPLLSYIADLQNETGMVIKQAEDEITAAQMVSGAMHMGARALTGTSGGGFDLMSETLSMNAILENPTVFVLAQRPGPATGLPTWTAQGDLLLAVHTGHGEYARCVLSVSDAHDAFHLMPEAFNIAEKYQISVIVLTDKQVAEALYTQAPYDQSIATIERGLVTDPAELKALKSSDRYDPDHIKYDVSPRWLPGTEAATWNAQGDEHDAAGNVDEGAQNAKDQMLKRNRKGHILRRTLPEPELFMVEDGQWTMTDDEPKFDLLLLGWGSTKSVVMDALRSPELRGKKIGYLHYTYLWPLKTERFVTLRKKAKHLVAIEGNHMGQLGLLLRQECGGDYVEHIFKYDGRPFFYDELVACITGRLTPKK
jgi:2-oxoglutarate/2-oxoacid ferredoxin oxidoreductase subunit alpha